MIRLPMPAAPDTVGYQSRIFVSVVSHGHEQHILETLQPHFWQSETTNIIPLVISNLPSQQLRRYCEKSGIAYIENIQKLGFGANNNKAFRYLESTCDMTEGDFFFTINPDISTSGHDIAAIARTMQNEQLQIAAPNLVDANGSPDDNIRSYPSLIDCILRFALRSRRSTINKEEMESTHRVDWAAGAYLAFSVKAYRALDGFDEKYFMYYEDADICRRARNKGIATYYLPTIRAAHFAARNSRKLLSWQFIWHITSALRFILKRQSNNNRSYQT